MIRQYDTHPLICNEDILGFGGFQNTDRMFCVIANGDNNFLEYGIAENSLLVVDPTKPYEQNKLNIFLTQRIGSKQDYIKLSLMQPEDSVFIGRVIMSISQFS